jgi:hypothetical protein
MEGRLLSLQVLGCLQKQLKGLLKLGGFCTQWRDPCFIKLNEIFA